MNRSQEPVASNLVSRLVELGVLHEVTGHARNRRFSDAPYIALFTEGSELESPP